ncbi:MAG: TonB-dependent receptor [Rubricoccaceae bacterium]|nr:TonB-dependent receptor [Rubricoccaceae bacterium]
MPHRAPPVRRPRARRAAPAALAAALLLLAGASASAQTGKIAGTVTDALTGEPLPGVNVVIGGTSQGAATDLDGRYAIIGVRPDTYDVVFSYIGYQTQRVEDVRVRIDLTTTVDADLNEEAIEGEEVVVEATRPLIQRDLTATTAFVSGEEIRAIPVENFNDVVELQAGVVDGHFRGGRIGEVGYWIDGIPVTDVYDGGLALEIENNSVQELQVVTGAFNAEYGQALSGIVNVVTREGSNDFEANVSAFAGDYATGEGSVDAGGAEGDLPLFPGTGIDDFSVTDVRNVEGAFSGPVLRDRLFFFGSGRYFANDGFILGRRVFGFDDVGLDQNGRLSLLNPDGSGDSTVVALNPYEKYSGQGKLTLRLGGGIRLSGSLLASYEEFKDPAGRDLFDFYFHPDAIREGRRTATTAFLKWTHLLSNTTFYEVGLTNNRAVFENFLFEDPLDERYRDPAFIGFRDQATASGFAIGGTDNGRFERTTDTWLAKVDLSSQVNSFNLVKTGVEVRYHTLDFLDQFTFVDAQGTLDPQVFTNGAYEYSPVEFAAYLQDKIELGGLIINAGLRFDYFDANGVVFQDPTDPDAVFLERRLAPQFEANPNLGFDDIDFTPDAFFTDTEAKWQVSPRLGVAFPISAGGVVHFSYGRFFQVPNFELLYQNPFFSLGSAGSGLIGLIGNADLEPEQTVNGEIGLKQEIGSSSAVEITAYYRDIRNLAGTATDPIVIAGTSARYGRLVNSDFGFVRGIILRFDQRIGTNFFAGVDYTYQVAEANASDPNEVYNAAAANGIREQQIVPTGWDQRHTANASLTYTNPALDAGFGLVATYGSGQPYTPARTSRVTGGTVPPTVIPLNSETKPAEFNLNLNAYKNFDVAGTQIQVFTKVDNVFDTRNELGVFGDTGRASYSLEESIEAATFSGDPLFLQRRYTRPTFFNEPRRVTLGLRLNL